MSTSIPEKCQTCGCHPPGFKNFEKQVHCEICVPPEPEKIVAAAIKEGPVVYTGPHHSTIIHYIVKCAGMSRVKGQQGFVTSTGRFVDRAEALAIAIKAKQVEADLVSSIGLMSENLWLVPEATEEEITEAVRQALLKENMPTVYRRINGKGPIYAITGTASIAYANKLEEVLLAWADTEILATRASEARMLRRLEESQAALSEAVRVAVEKNQKIVTQAMDALESDATLDQRRGAWDALRDAFFPLPPDAQATPAPTTPSGDPDMFPHLRATLPSRRATPAPEPICIRCKEGRPLVRNFGKPGHLCQHMSAMDPITYEWEACWPGTPPETGEKEKP